MKVGDKVYVSGYVDEIRKDTVIIRNSGGYFGTISDEILFEPPERKEGHWIPIEGNLWSEYECDQCGKKSDYKERYYAHCGASMLGDKT